MSDAITVHPPNLMELEAVWRCPLCGKLLKRTSTDEQGREHLSCTDKHCAMHDDDDGPLLLHDPFDYNKGANDIAWAISYVG
jgi:hypothetical protein